MLTESLPRVVAAVLAWLGAVEPGNACQEVKNTLNLLVQEDLA